MSLDAELVMLAIRSAVRLGEQARHAYADSVRSAAITLPLPDFPADPGIDSIETFYRSDEGRPIAAGNARVTMLLKRLAQVGSAGLASEEADEFARLYAEHWTLAEARAGRFTGAAEAARGITNETVVVFLSVRQWREGEDPHPTVLRRLAGTLVNIAIDYAQTLPDLAVGNSARARLLAAFLERFGDVDFVEAHPVEVVPAMLVGLLELVADSADLLTGDPRAQVLVQNVAGAVYEVVRARAAAGATIAERASLERVGAEVFQAVVTGAAGAVRTHPELFLKASSPARADLMQATAGVLIDAFVTAAHGDPERAYGRATFARLAEAGLLAVSRHPELVAGNTPFVTALIRDTAADVATVLAHVPGEPFDADTIVPEIVRGILMRTAEHFELLAPAGLAHPERHLLVIATQHALRAITATPADGARWRARWSEADTLALIDLVLDEVAQNPAWVDRGVRDPVVAELLRELVGVVRLSGGPALSPATGVAVIETALRAAGRRHALQVADARGRRYAPLVLEAALAAIFGERVAAEVAWIAVREQATRDIVQAAFGALESRMVDDASVALLVGALPLALGTWARGGGTDATTLSALIVEAMA